MKKIIAAFLLTVIATSAFAQDEERNESDLKGKFRRDNIFLGGGIGLSVGGWATGFSIGANPEVGYSVAQWLDAGIATNINYFSYKAEYNNGVRQRSTTLGVGPFVRLYPLRNFFIQVQPEYNWITTKLRYVKEVEASLAKIDWNKIETDVREAADKVKNVDIAKIKEDMKRVEADLKKQDFDIKINSEKIKQDVSKAMENAKVSIENAKVEIRLMKEFTNELEKDGLIDKKKEFKIEVKSGELYINDKKQPQNVSDKYRKYYKKENFSIHSDGRDKDGVSI